MREFGASRWIIPRVERNGSATRRLASPTCASGSTRTSDPAPCRRRPPVLSSTSGRLTPVVTKCHPGRDALRRCGGFRRPIEEQNHAQEVRNCTHRRWRRRNCRLRSRRHRQRSPNGGGGCVQKGLQTIRTVASIREAAQQKIDYSDLAGPDGIRLPLEEGAFLSLVDAVECFFGAHLANVDDGADPTATTARRRSASARSYCGCVNDV